MFLLKSMLTHKRNVLLVGPTGTGKSVYVAAQLRRLASGFDQPHLENGALAKEKKISYTTTCALSFSAQTSANTTQDIIDAQVYKIRKGIYGPSSGGKRMVALEQRHGFFFVDDLNMPQKEEYGKYFKRRSERESVQSRIWKSTCSLNFYSSSLFQTCFIGFVTYLLYSRTPKQVFF